MSGSVLGRPDRPDEQGDSTSVADVTDTGKGVAAADAVYTAGKTLRGTCPHRGTVHSGAGVYPDCAVISNIVIEFDASGALAFYGSEQHMC